MNTALSARIAADYAAAFPAAPAARRRAAFAALSGAGLPSTRDENWKYANLRGLERLSFRPAAPDMALPDPAHLPAPIPGFARYVFVDGRFAPELSAPVDGAFTSLAGSPAARSGSEPAALNTDQRFALLNEVFATDGARLRVSSGAG